MKTYTEKRFFQWHEDDISVTLRGMSGSYGGGSEVLVIQHATYSMQRIGQYKESGQASALKERDYKDATDLITGGG